MVEAAGEAAAGARMSLQLHCRHSSCPRGEHWKDAELIPSSYEEPLEEDHCGCWNEVGVAAASSCWVEGGI